MTQDPRYPIGKYEALPFSEATKKAWIHELKVAPTNLELTVQHLDKAQLDTPYREGGWTVQQVIHHLADSHMNAFIRFKLGLTEDNPTIKPYIQQKWSETPDVLNVPVNYSVTLIHSLHHRWYELLKSMTDEDWQRTLFHPEQKREITLWEMLLIYAWHGKHHLTQLQRYAHNQGWITLA